VELMRDGANLSGSSTSTGSFGKLLGDGSQLTGISTGGLSNIVEDTTPQLGGDLDLNSNDITGTGNISITGGLTLAGSGPNINGAGGNVYMIPTNFIVRSNITNDSGDVKVNDNLTVTGNVSGSSTSTGSFGDGRIAGRLGIQTSGTPRGPIDVMGSLGSQGFYLSDSGGAVKLPTDVGHSSGAGTFDFQVENFRLGRNGYGVVSVYPRFNSMLQLGTQDDSNLLTLSGSTHISGSAISTGSFADGRFIGKVAIGTTSSPTTDLAIGGASYTGGGLYVAAGSSNRVALLGNIEVTTGTGGSWSGQSINAEGTNRTLRFAAGGNLNASDSSIFVFNGVQGNARTVDQNTFEIVGGYGNATLKADYSFMKIGGTVNQTNAAQSGSVIGIEYDPSFTASPTGSHTAFLATSGDIVSRGTNAVISGSSTSTGSFGRGVIADTLRINKVNASATPLMIGAPSSNMAVFHISNHLGNESFRVDVSSDGDSALTMRDSGQNADILLHTATNTYFNHNGNFGIGRTDPGYKLDVLHNGDDQFRVGRSGAKYVAIRDDVMQFTGMTGNGMRIQTSDNSDIKFSAGTGDIIFDYGNSGGKVISYADIRVHGDIIAENYIVSSSTTYMTQSFSSGSTIFGDSTDDTHQFTGSLNLSGSLNINSISTTTSGDANAGVTLKAGGEKILQGWNEGNVNIGNGTFTTAYKIMLHGTTKVQNAHFVVDQNKKLAWGNQTVYLAGSEANGIDFYHSSTHLGRWRTAGLGVNTNITASGNIEVVGNISGSSTSTGSFGHLFISEKDGFANVQANGSIKFKRTDSNYEVARFESNAMTYTDLNISNGTNVAGIRMRGGHLRVNKWLVGTTPTFELDGDNRLQVEGLTRINGDLQVTGSISEPSTMRIKTNIETLESPLDKITKLRGVSYNLKRGNQPNIGMIAEEVDEIFPELVSKDKDGNPEAMSYSRMTAVLLEAIKELKQEVDELRQENIYIKDMNRKNK